MGKNKVLVKVHPEGKYVVDIDKGVDHSAIAPGMRVALRNDSYALHLLLPTKVDPLVSLMKVEKVPDSTYDMVGGLDRQIKVRKICYCRGSFRFCCCSGTKRERETESRNKKNSRSLSLSLSLSLPFFFSFFPLSLSFSFSFKKKHFRQEIKEVIELPIKHPELFDALGVAQPKGVLLYGPPGTGKTLLARAVAHHTDCTFIRVSGSELVQKYIGEGSRMVRELFVMAREHAPSIIFMYEVSFFRG